MVSKKLSTRFTGILLGLFFLIPVTFDASAGAPPPTGPDTPVDIKMDGDTFRYYMETLLPDDTSPAFKEVFNDVFTQIREVRLQGTRKELKLEADLYHALQLRFSKRGQAREFQLYEILLPSHLRFRLAFKNPELVLEPIGSARKSFIFKLRMPLFLDRIYFHGVTLNPMTGDLEAKAGIVGDLIRVHKKMNVFKNPKHPPKTLAPTDPTRDLLQQITPMFLPFLDTDWEKEK